MQSVSFSSLLSKPQYNNSYVEPTLDKSSITKPAFETKHMSGFDLLTLNMYRTHPFPTVRTLTTSMLSPVCEPEI